MLRNSLKKIQWLFFLKKEMALFSRRVNQSDKFSWIYECVLYCVRGGQFLRKKWYRINDKEWSSHAVRYFLTSSFFTSIRACIYTHMYTIKYTKCSPLSFCKHDLYNFTFPSYRRSERTLSHLLYNFAIWHSNYQHGRKKSSIDTSKVHFQRRQLYLDSAIRRDSSPLAFVAHAIYPFWISIMPRVI